MKLERMTGPEHPLYAAAWALYEAAFPANERRDEEWQARALRRTHIILCRSGGWALCAIAFYWMHGGELFLEHLAVASELRADAGSVRRCCGRSGIAGEADPRDR